MTPQAERDLLGDMGGESTEEELDFVDDESENLSLEEILALAEQEEQKCGELEERSRRQRDEERRQKQARKEALARLKQARARRADLEKTSSEPQPQSTPQRTRRPLPTATSTATKPPRLSAALGSEGERRNRNQPQGESDDFDDFASQLIDSVKQLQGGRANQFGAIMAKIMAQAGGGAPNVGAGPSAAPVGYSKNASNLKYDNVAFIPSVRKADSLPNVHFEPRSTDSNETARENYPRVVGEFKVEPTDCEANVLNVNNVVVDSGSATGGARPKKVGKRAETPEEGQLTDSDSSPDRRRGRRLKSGLLTRPDEAGIKQQVKYAHEKLDPVHVKDRVFKELNFHFFVAGELELITSSDLEAEEKNARLHFLKILCYHREYLEISDLKDQYVANLQLIERGEANWAEFRSLTSQLHTNLTFRANVKSRERENATVAKLEKLVAGDGGKKLDSKVKNPKEPTNIVGKVIYCSYYNKGACPFDDHHEGVFNKKPVTKWHICCRCLVQDGHPRRSHPEGDPACPLRT